MADHTLRRFLWADALLLLTILLIVSVLANDAH